MKWWLLSLLERGLYLEENCIFIDMYLRIQNICCSQVFWQMPLSCTFIISLEDKSEVQHLQKFLLEILFWCVHNFTKHWPFKLKFTACFLHKGICKSFFFKVYVFCFGFDLWQCGKKTNPPSNRKKFSYFEKDWKQMAKDWKYFFNKITDSFGGEKCIDHLQ